MWWTPISYRHELDGKRPRQVVEECRRRERPMARLADRLLDNWFGLWTTSS